jgi:hypothetical protein
MRLENQNDWLTKYRVEYIVRMTKVQLWSVEPLRCVITSCAVVGHGSRCQAELRSSL